MLSEVEVAKPENNKMVFTFHKRVNTLSIKILYMYIHISIWIQGPSRMYGNRLSPIFREGCRISCQKNCDFCSMSLFVESMICRKTICCQIWLGSPGSSIY